MATHAKSQDFGGRVIDEKGEPMPFVNVVLLSLPDSVFVQGAMTDEQGLFKIVTNVDEGLFKVTSVGYETVYVAAGHGLTIQMKEDSQLLNEVVVKGQLPKTHVKGDAMRTTVAGTILEKAGTVSDALGKIPSLETERGGSVKVLGRGEAEVYINGRRVQDMNELARLRSDQIQHVDVVQNPGARYAASTKAVVRITLKKAQGEGFSFQDYFSGIYQYGHTLTNNLDVNYRTGGIDITASLWAGRYGHAKSLQEHEMTYFVGPDYIESNTSQESMSIWKGWSPQLQVNYMVDENHSFGAFYKYDRHPSSDFNSMFYTDNYENGRYTEHSESRIWQDESFSKHIFNAYYNGKIGQLGIDLNVDGLFDDTKTPGSTTEVTRASPSPSQGGGVELHNSADITTSSSNQTSPPLEGLGEARTIESNTNSGNNFCAAKLIFSYPVWKGNLSLGGEYSYNHRTDAYSFTATDYVPVKTTDTEINEKSSAAFVEYGRSIPFSIFDSQFSIFVQVGLRYEHLSNSLTPDPSPKERGVYSPAIENAADKGDHSPLPGRGAGGEASWFPTAVISAPVGKAQLSLSYRRDIERPNYANLTSSTVYVNRYTYQSGNPYLLPTYTHSLVFNAAYRWANLTLNYGRVKDAVTMSTEPFPGSEDPLVSLVRPINSWEDYNQFSIQLSARPNFQFSILNSQLKWHPMWTIITQLQDFKSPTANGSTITLNHPWFIIGWQNDIELPRGFRLNVSSQWTSKGDYNNFRMTRTRLFTNFGVQRDFNLKRMGTLTFDLRCSDPFHTNKTDAIVYGYRELATHNPARRTFMLDITWKFNEARSKYRGSGAGDKQKARM
jgi:hypothetical protein